MTKFSNVNVGLAPNDGTGTPLRDSFIILNNNFSYINQVIWPDISQAQITANVVSSYISRFNLIQAATVESKLIGNTGTAYYGNTYSASNSFQGQLGKYGGNAAIVSTLSATGNVAVANLTVNGTATLSSITIGSINDTPIGNSTPSTGSFTTLSSSSDISLRGNLTGIHFAVYSVSNLFGSNLASPFTLTIAPGENRRRFFGFTINTNTTITYGTISTGSERTIVIKNYQDNTAREIVLPNNFNNKGISTIPIAANANVMLQFIPFDTTAANVYVNITNS